ncbi:hypothetical protein EON65_50340 [archaeon]|nr:MAG: hypothetical protein EON65_50340 [archaeon]
MAAQEEAKKRKEEELIERVASQVADEFESTGEDRECFVGLSYSSTGGYSCKNTKDLEVYKTTVHHAFRANDLLAVERAKEKQELATRNATRKLTGREVEEYHCKVKIDMLKKMENSPY